MSRSSSSSSCNVIVTPRHVDPWNIQQWKDWEFCQGTYKRLYALDTTMARPELYLVNEFINQLNDDYKFQRHFMLVTKLPITLEKHKKYNILTFFVYDTKSTITRKYVFHYRWLNAQQVKVLKGFRSSTELEDKVVMPAAGYNIDKYNQLQQTFASYFFNLDDHDTPRLAPFPLNHNMYSYNNAPSNLDGAFDQNGPIKLPEKAGVFKASNYSAAAF